MSMCISIAQACAKRCSLDSRSAFYPGHFYTKWLLWHTRDHPPPLKMYREGGGGREFFIHFHPPSLKRVLLYELLFDKIKNVKRWGVLLIDFEYLASKACLEKGGGGCIHWFCKAMDLWCSWSFPGESYEIAWRFWGPSPWNLSLPWVNTLRMPKFGGEGCEIWKGGIEMGGGFRWSIMNVCTWGVSSSFTPHIHCTWRLSWEA